MRRAHVRELLKDVSVGPEAGGWTLIFRQEGDPVVDHVISEDPAVGILGGFRWVETQHVGKCPLLVEQAASALTEWPLALRKIPSSVLSARHTHVGLSTRVNDL